MCINFAEIDFFKVFLVSMMFMCLVGLGVTFYQMLTMDRK